MPLQEFRLAYGSFTQRINLNGKLTVLASKIKIKLNHRENLLTVASPRIPIVPHAAFLRNMVSAWML